MLTLKTGLAVKIPTSKFKTADSRHLEKWKNGHISATA